MDQEKRRKWLVEDFKLESINTHRPITINITRTLICRGGQKFFVDQKKVQGQDPLYLSLEEGTSKVIRKREYRNFLSDKMSGTRTLEILRYRIFGENVEGELDLYEKPSKPKIVLFIGDNLPVNLQGIEVTDNPEYCDDYLIQG